MLKLIDVWWTIESNSRKEKPAPPLPPEQPQVDNHDGQKGRYAGGTKRSSCHGGGAQIQWSTSCGRHQWCNFTGSKIYIFFTLPLQRTDIYIHSQILLITLPNATKYTQICRSGTNCTFCARRGGQSWWLLVYVDDDKMLRRHGYP
jgi:hypothetical protein